MSCLTGSSSWYIALLPHLLHRSFALLGICERNSPVTDGFTSQRASDVVESVSATWRYYTALLSHLLHILIFIRGWRFAFHLSVHGRHQLITDAVQYAHLQYACDLWCNSMDLHCITIIMCATISISVNIRWWSPGQSCHSQVANDAILWINQIEQPIMANRNAIKRSQMHFCTKW